MLLTVSNAAQRLGKSEDTIRRWADTGLLGCVRLGNGTRLFRLADVERLVDRLRD